MYGKGCLISKHHLRTPTRADVVGGLDAEGPVEEADESRDARRLRRPAEEPLPVTRWVRAPEGVARARESYHRAVYMEKKNMKVQNKHKDSRDKFVSPMNG